MTTAEEPQLELDNLRNALDHIRSAASLHYLGAAFEPEHMRGIANLCIDALNGEDIPPMPDLHEIRARAAAFAEGLEQLWD
jgi:hypothetical protein